MKVIIYVEGVSDKLTLQTLLKSVIEEKHREGISIKIFESPKGDRKKTLLTQIPIKAANIIINDPTAIVLAIPDLYPMNVAFPHVTVRELETGIKDNFYTALKNKNIKDQRFEKRFHVFCFKHDMEVLILAAKQNLSDYLGIANLNVGWTIPVEDQNGNMPPKRVIEEIFKQYGKKYKSTVDAPLILKSLDYRDLVSQCPQCFKPFVTFLCNL